MPIYYNYYTNWPQAQHAQPNRTVPSALQTAGGHRANKSRHFDSQCSTRVFVDNVAYGDGRQHLQEVWRNTTIESSKSLLPHNLAEQSRHCLLAAVRIAALQWNLSFPRLTGNCFSGCHKERNQSQLAKA